MEDNRMYNPDQKQYILKNSFGVSYHVYFEPERGLCIRMLSDSRIWSRGYILDKFAINDFAVVLDNNDIFHFVFQTDKGNVMYGHGMHGQIEIRPILSSREATTYPKHVSLLISGNAVFIFYIIKHQNQHIISMQYVQDGILSNPLAIDYVDHPSYIPFLDTMGKCHLVYINNNHGKMQVKHRALKDDFSIFTAPDTIHSCEGIISSLSYVLTNANNVFITFEVFADESYEVIFKDLLQANHSKVLYNSKSPSGLSGLLYCSGILYFYHTVKDSIYFLYSDDNGSTWSNQALYSDLDNPICFSYTSNYPKDARVSCQQIPGNFSRGYNVAFLNDEAVKKMQEVKQLNKNDEGNNLNYKDLKSKVLQLQNQTNIMEKELTKVWATQKMFEKKIKHLNLLYEQLHNIVNYEHMDAHINNQDEEPIYEINKEPVYEQNQEPVSVQSKGLVYDINEELVNALDEEPIKNQDVFDDTTQAELLDDSSKNLQEENTNL